ncbi:hypothetical protein TRE132_17460 [Pseudomonas chlororaphis subsp. aurantiaca]|uniref:hypothetical protein n=1 Tax=Pseudomonas chlororaphis TaxID=587753 RepID=UPI000865A6B5|nr:hypothetical protein [Pseudomonas chlororaphis]BAV73708.1 hypothetical protein PCAU_1499 [Pseudomonas chlororaphis subsp. aurantiaca]BBN53621.1 hypothetical protein TRE132_17460 [Pseudomonas chlororaphis subsp. aurantiaca]
MKKSLNKPYFAPMAFWLCVVAVLLALHGFADVEVPQLIYFSLAPVYLLVLFIFLYYFFCWSFISVFPLGEVGWKRVDYGWLLLASLALISETQNVRTEWFQSDYRLAESHEAATQRRLKAEIDDLLGPDHCRAAATVHSAADAAQVNELCQRFAALERTAQGQLTALSVGTVVQTLDELRARYSAPPVLAWLGRLDETLGDQRKARGEVSRLYQLTRATNAETVYRYFVPVLLVIALALRASKVTGEVLLKAPRKRKVWMIINRRMVIDGLGFVRGARSRFDEALHNWRVAKWDVVHLACPFLPEVSAQDTRVAVAPGFYENEFQLASVSTFEQCGFVEWAARQSIETLYLVGETDLALIERVRQWGETAKVEVLVRERI